MWFTFQAEPRWPAGLRGAARCRTSAAPLAGWGAPGVPQNQKRSRAFQEVFLTWNGINLDFLGCGPFCWHIFPLNIFSDPAISMFFDLLITDSFNNRCEFLFRKQRETLEFLFREQKSILRLGEEITMGYPEKRRTPSGKDEENNSLQSRPVFYCAATIEGQLRRKISPLSYTSLPLCFSA